MAEHETGRSAHHHPAPAPTPEAWIKTELARHPQRPYPMDFIEALFTDFSEIHGDRAFSDDAAMTCGMASFHGAPVLVIGNLKGRTLKERVERKFGSPDPEGYRKALRCMKLAEKFNRPVFTFLDLAGAFPGIGAEERGQGEAIAKNLIEMSQLRVPTIATITGEGGGGGALGCVDDIIAEPKGGSQADPGEAFALVNERLVHHFGELKAMSVDDLVAK